MRGSIWTVAIGAVGAGLLLRAVNVAMPSSPSTTTQNAASILDVLSPVAGLLLLLFCIGALWTMTAAQGW